MIQYDVPRPWSMGEQLVGDDFEEVVERNNIKKWRITPSKLPGVAPPPQQFPAHGMDTSSILGPAGLSAGRLDHRFQK